MAEPAMEYFDYQPIADEAGLSPGELTRIVERVQRDYPQDQMLCELHVLRACRAIRDGRVTLEQVLTEPSTARR